MGDLQAGILGSGIGALVIREERFAEHILVRRLVVHLTILLLQGGVHLSLTHLVHF